MNQIKVLSVFGTRPEAIKMCPLILELERNPHFTSIVCVTAQHRQMLDSVLSLFNVTPDYDLDIMQSGQTLSDITGRILEKLGAIIRNERPDLVLVHGDTTTTFASALAAFYEKVAVGHVEAGLRTYDKYSPFPEELNRCMVSRIADYHFAPTAQNKANLERESVTGKIFVTGNTVIDAMDYTVSDSPFDCDALSGVDFSKQIITLTCHRRENYGQNMQQIFAAAAKIAEAFPDSLTIYPVHMSPVVQKAAEERLGSCKNILRIPPLDAADMHKLMSRSYMVMTDSGGIQEEAPALGKPVLVLRRETERPEAVKAGTVALAGVETENIFRLACLLMSDKSEYEKMAKAVNPYGDGKACKRIADALSYGFDITKTRPEDFIP